MTFSFSPASIGSPVTSALRKLNAVASRPSGLFRYSAESARTSMRTTPSSSGPCGNSTAEFHTSRFFVTSSTTIASPVNELTYVVQPIRHLVLDHLDLTAAGQERLVPVLTWFAWEVPIGVQLGTVAVITLGPCALAARIFTTTG